MSVYKLNQTFVIDFIIKTPEFIKEVWKAIQFTMYRTTSTKDLTTKQIDEVFDVLNKFLGENFSIHVPFPSMETMMLNQLDNEAMR